MGESRRCDPLDPWTTCNAAFPTRWNRALPEEFDVASERFPARSSEEALVSKFLGIEIKHVERRHLRIPSVRMGAFLSAVNQEIGKDWNVQDLRNLDWEGRETTPLYEVIQLNSRESQDFLIDGMRFLKSHEKDGVIEKVTFRVSPGWYGLDVTAYGMRTLGTVDHLLMQIQTAAKEFKFLQGEAFSLSGEFLPKSSEDFDDLFLNPTNAAAIQRVITLVNEKGASIDNRGLLLMGPPGTGKTLSARIVRNKANATFIHVSARDFWYAGGFGGFTESFDLARENAPSVIVFEDVDNWLTPRTVDLIKTEMDGVMQSKGVVTIMTTNYPELLPAALIDRPGRFHDVLKFDLPDADARRKMLARWFPSVTGEPLDAAVEATEGYSGAHVRELARFATIIGEQDGLEPDAALIKALDKLAEQRELISATQRSQAYYRTPPELVAKGPVRMDTPELVAKNFQPLGECRAYAQVEVKSFDEEQRVVEGIATDPQPDRVGDIIESLGTTFKNPVSFLLYHDKTKPVGTVEFGPPRADGVPFKASLPKIKEEGTLKQRVEEAWHTIKYLKPAVSIGFRPVENAVERLKSGGIRFLKTELLELSLVSVPANVNAQIHVVKSVTDKALAVPRQDAPASVVVSSRPAPRTPPAPRRKDATTMKPIAEQISGWEQTRQTEAAKMGALMAKSSETGETLSDEDQQEYDAASERVKSINAQIERLKTLESLNLGAATQVVGSTQVAASNARAGMSPHITVRANREVGIEFARYAMVLAVAKGDPSSALNILKARYPDEARIETILKAAVAAGTTTDPTWAGALVDYVNFAGDFVEFLRPRTIIGQFGANGVPSLRQVPFNISVPGQTTGGEGYWVGEGKPKPVTKFDFAPITLRWAKVANIAVLTQELVRFSNPSAERLVREALAAAIIARIDTDFVDPAKAAVADVSPASITNGITPIASSGTDANAVRLDIAALYAPFIAANLAPTNGVFIMNSTLALALSLMTNALGQPEFPGIGLTGGRFFGLPVIVSDYVPSGIVILVNASDIYLSDDGQVVIDASREASLQMDTAPTNASADTASPPAPIPTTLVSLWQTNSIGLKAERFINWQRRREEAVQYLENVAWAAGSPA